MNGFGAPVSLSTSGPVSVNVIGNPARNAPPISPVISTGAAGDSPAPASAAGSAYSPRSPVGFRGRSGDAPGG